MLSKCSANLFVFVYTFFFIYTWRIVIRQFQVMWLPGDNHILEPLDALHTLRLCTSQECDYLIHALFHDMSLCPSVFTVLSYRFFSPFPPIMSIQPYNHTKNSVRKQQPPQNPTEQYTEPTIWVLFFPTLNCTMCYIFQ